jgi:uncharacterized protein
MTATTAARPGTETAPPRLPPRRRARWLLVAVALVAVVAAAPFLRPGDQPGTHGFVPLDPAVQGTYRLDDGQHLTLWGSERSPSYELDGRVTRLMAEDADRYTAMAGEETLSVQRDGTGTVEGVILQRPDEPTIFAVPDLLHGEQGLRFASAGAELAGTLLIPPGPGPHPAVVFVHGADPGSRHGVYRLLGSHLARRGVATLIYDKRGVGESTGSHAGATFDDLTADALAGVDVVTAHPAIDPARVGVLGFSQGGWIVAEAAQRSDDVAFVIAFGASGFSPGGQQAWLHGSMLAARGFDRSAMAIADRVDRMLYSSLDLVAAGIMPSIPHVPGFWFHSLDLHMDSAAVWEGVRQPVLLAWGALDCQVPAHDSMTVLGQALERGGNSDVTLTVLPGADHSLALLEPCEMEAGGHHGTSDYAEGYLGLAADWINGLDDPARVDRAPQVAERPDDTVLAWHLDPPAPAPWYGTLAFQLAALLFLLATFGAVGGRWLARVAAAAVSRRNSVSRASHLAGVTALAGLAATVTGFAAFAEIAMLGDVHAAFIVGGPTVRGTSVLVGAARLLVPLAMGLSVAAMVATIRTDRKARSRSSWIVVAAAITLLAWGAYWRLLSLI